MKYTNLHIQTPAEAKAIIDTAEKNFAAALDRAIDTVLSDGRIKIITLSGPTCSGKTTTASRLIARLTEAGYHAVLLSIDDFFLDRTRTNDVSAEKPDYDTVKALDLAEFARCVCRLKEGKPTLIPHYDFPTGKRDSYTEYLPEKKDIYIFEGIQAVYPEVLALLGSDHDFDSIFIHVAEGVEAESVTLAPHEIRLFRRIVRDYRFRSANPEFTLFLWENVRVNEEENIYPNAGNCDVTINSFLPYEPFILAKNVLPLLAAVPLDSEYRAEADALGAKLSHFVNPNFDESMIPVDSVYREFIGKD